MEVTSPVGSPKSYPVHQSITDNDSSFVTILNELFILQVIQGKVKENYNMDMWIKQCDRGVMSCYIAQVKRITRLLSKCRNSLIIMCYHGICHFRDSMMNKIQCSGAAQATTFLMIRNARLSNR